MHVILPHLCVRHPNLHSKHIVLIQGTTMEVQQRSVDFLAPCFERNSEWIMHTLMRRDIAVCIQVVFARPPVILLTVRAHNKLAGVFRHLRVTQAHGISKPTSNPLPGPAPVIKSSSVILLGWEARAQNTHKGHDKFCLTNER